MAPNSAGGMVTDTWGSIPEQYPTATVDGFVVMPNHVHGIIWFTPRDGHGNPSLGDVMKWFKTRTTNEYIRGVRSNGWPPFDRHLWQRNYHEHIVRNDADLERIREYIANNPARWQEDAYHASSG